MKIAHIISSLDTGGKERLVIDLVTIHSKSLHEAILIVINDDNCLDMLSELHANGIRVIQLMRNRRGSLLHFIFKLIKIFAVEKPDVVHMHDDISIVLGLFASFRLKCIRVTTLHDVGLYSRKIKGRIAKIVSLAFIDRFIAISNSVYDDYFDGRTVKNANVVLNGIRLNAFAASFSSRHDCEIICVARLELPKKGQDVLLNALALLNQMGFKCRCLLVGVGPSRADLERLCIHLNVSDQVVFSGFSKNVAKLLARAPIFVLPSRWEGFGLAVVEAMATGMTVICSNIDGPKQIIQDGLSGLLFRAGSAEDLALQIKRALSDRDLRTQLGQNALLAAKKYSIESMHCQYLKLYEETAPHFLVMNLSNFFRGLSSILSRKSLNCIVTHE